MSPTYFIYKPKRLKIDYDYLPFQIKIISSNVTTWQKSNHCQIGLFLPPTEGPLDPLCLVMTCELVLSLSLCLGAFNYLALHSPCSLGHWFGDTFISSQIWSWMPCRDHSKHPIYLDSKFSITSLFLTIRA
jgi:hypothetical protein